MIATAATNAQPVLVIAAICILFTIHDIALTLSVDGNHDDDSNNEIVPIKIIDVCTWSMAFRTNSIPLECYGCPQSNGSNHHHDDREAVSAPPTHWNE